MSKHDKLLDVLHGTAQGLHAAGVMDTTTLREFDALLSVASTRLYGGTNQAFVCASRRARLCLRPTSTPVLRRRTEAGTRGKNTQTALTETVNPGDRKGLEVLA